MVGPWQIGVVFFAVYLIMILPFVFYLLTLQNTLRVVSIENRTIPPEQVWLSFIPIFGLV